MDIDAEMRRKIGASITASLLFIALLVGIGIQYGQAGPGDEGIVLTEIGSTYLVAVIALFVLLMGAIGVYLDRQSSE